MAALPTSSDYRAAFDALNSKLAEIKGAGEALSNWGRELCFGRRRPDASALANEEKTITAQFGKLREMVSDAENRYLSKVDSLDEAFVEKIQALISLPPGPIEHVADPGKSINLVGLQLLRSACDDFTKAKAKGDFSLRRAHYNAVIELLTNVVFAMGKPESKHAGREQLAIYNRFMTTADPEEKSQIYSEHKAVILAVEDLKNAN